jgi:hypothetical protein
LCQSINSTFFRFIFISVLDCKVPSLEKWGDCFLSFPRPSIHPVDTFFLLLVLDSISPSVPSVITSHAFFPHSVSFSRCCPDFLFFLRCFAPLVMEGSDDVSVESAGAELSRWPS